MVTSGRISRLLSPRPWRYIWFRGDQVIRGRRRKPQSLETHIRGLVGWLLRAQAAAPDGGIAESYQVLTDTWRPSYPETTGYVICSLLRAANAGIVEAPVIRTAAARMGEWLADIQFAEGGIQGGALGTRPVQPVVFNTAQVIKGWTDLLTAGLDTRHRLEAAAKLAAAWLVEVQDADGAWRRGKSPLTSSDVQAYNIRSAWALARYGRAVGTAALCDAAVRNGEWLMSVRDEGGWFPHMNFDVGAHPLTHTVAYTIQGLLELGVLMERADFVDAATQVARQMLDLQDANGALPGLIAPGYKSAAGWTTCTGNSQMAIIWFRLEQLTGDPVWRLAAIRANRFNQSLHELDHPNPGRRGAVCGSWPAHLGYGRFWYMNWTQKFFLDALLAEHGIAIC